MIRMRFLVLLLGVSGATFLALAFTLSDGVGWSWWLLAALVSFLVGGLVLLAVAGVADSFARTRLGRRWRRRQRERERSGLAVLDAWHQQHDPS